MTTKASKNRTIMHLEGLRGLAILMVILFHYFSTFRNGFLGVDVFLVLSGYLLFRHFWQDYDTFDAKVFVTKKIQRLFPLAAAVVILCCVAAPFFFPANLSLLGAKSAVATLFGYANLHLDATSSNYFSTDARLNPLTHTWYLSVITQIYLLYAVSAWVFRKKSYRVKTVALSAVSLISLAVYYIPMWLPGMKSVSTYYWTSGRLWMILAGAFALFLPQMKRGYLLAFPALILMALLGFCPLSFGPTRTMAAELLIVAGSMACIVYGGSGLTSRFLGCRVMQILGRYSFSLYMIHWPVLVFGEYVAAAYGVEDALEVKLLQVLIFAALGVLLFHLVENRKFTLKGNGVFLIVSASLIGLLIFTKGLKDEIHASVNAVKAETFGTTEHCLALKTGTLYDTLPEFLQEDHHGGFGGTPGKGESVPLLYSIGEQNAEPNFLLIGDSHAESLLPGLDALARKNGWHGAYLHTYVIPLENVFSARFAYQRWDKEKAETFYRYLEDNPQIRTVLLGCYWMRHLSSRYKDWQMVDVHVAPDENMNYACVYQFLKRIQACGKRIVVFADVPIMPEQALQDYIRRQLLYGRPIDNAKVSCTRAEYNQLNQEMNAHLARWEQEGLCAVLHPEEHLLQTGSCHCFRDGVLYYMDGHHLSLPGSVECIQALEGDLKVILNENNGK